MMFAELGFGVTPIVVSASGSNDCDSVVPPMTKLFASSLNQQ